MTPAAPLGEHAARKRERIHALDLGDGEPLANAPADPTLLYSLEELARGLKPLMGIDAPRDDNNRILEVRPKGRRDTGLSSRSRSCWVIIIPLAPGCSRMFVISCWK